MVMLTTVLEIRKKNLVEHLREQWAPTEPGGGAHPPMGVLGDRAPSKKILGFV